VSPTNPAWLEAATRAAANAREKAAAYAAGVDATLGALTALAEPEDSVRHVGFRALAASGGLDLPIDAGEQDVVASVEATFALKLS
jgi:uncharacterized protein YggE